MAERWSRTWTVCSGPGCAWRCLSGRGVVDRGRTATVAGAATGIASPDGQSCRRSHAASTPAPPPAVACCSATASGSACSGSAAVPLAGSPGPLPHPPATAGRCAANARWPLKMGQLCNLESGWWGGCLPACLAEALAACRCARPRRRCPTVADARAPQPTPRCRPQWRQQPLADVTTTTHSSRSAAASAAVASLWGTLGRRESCQKDCRSVRCSRRPTLHITTQGLST